MTEFMHFELGCVLLYYPDSSVQFDFNVGTPCLGDIFKEAISVVSENDLI